MANPTSSSLVEADRKDCSFEVARNVLRRAALRRAFTFRGLAHLCASGLVRKGGIFFLAGLVANGLFDERTGGTGRWLVGLILICVGLRCAVLVAQREPSVVSGTPYLPEGWFERLIFVFYAAPMLAVLWLNPSFAWAVAFQLCWFCLWIASAVVVMWYSDKPLILSEWWKGNLHYCNERDMVVDALTPWRWSEFSLCEKKALWNVLPNWKWDLYSYVSRRKNNGEPASVIECMQSEADPYWHLVFLMHDCNPSRSIKAYLQTRDGVALPEIYSLPL